MRDLRGDLYLALTIIFSILAATTLIYIVERPTKRVKLCLAFVQHLNLHWGEWGLVNSTTRLERARDYLRYFELLLDHPSIKHDISMPYWSLKFFKAHVPEALMRLRELVARGQVRIIDESWSPAVLPLHRLLIQEELLAENRVLVEAEFGTRVEGVFLQESAASEVVPYILSKLSYSWTCLFQFGKHPSLLIGPDGSRVLNIAPAINTYQWYNPRNSAERMYAMILEAARDLAGFYSPLPPLVVISGDFEAVLPSHTGVSLEVVEQAYDLIESDPDIEVVTVEEYLERYGEKLVQKLREVKCASSTWADNGHMIIWAGDPYDTRILATLLKAEALRETVELLISLAERWGLNASEWSSRLAPVLQVLYEATGSDGEGWRPTCVFRGYILELARTSEEELAVIAHDILREVARIRGRRLGSDHCFIVFNQLPLEREEWVVIPLRGLKACRAETSNGVEVPCMPVEGGVALWLKLEPLEIVSIHVEPSKEVWERKCTAMEVEGGVEISNGVISARISERGGVIEEVSLMGVQVFKGRADLMLIGGKPVEERAEIRVVREEPMRVVVELTWRLAGNVVEKYVELRAYEPFVRVRLNITFSSPKRIGRNFNLDGALALDTRLEGGEGRVVSQVAGGFVVELRRVLATPMRWHAYEVENGGLAVVTLGGLLMHGSHPSLVLGKSTTNLPCERFNGSYLYEYVLYPYGRGSEHPMWVAERLNRPPLTLKSSYEISIRSPVRVKADLNAIFINYFTLRRISIVNLSGSTADVGIDYGEEVLVTTVLSPNELFEWVGDW